MADGIRHQRLKRKIKLRDLADQAGVKLNSLSKWERGLERPDNESIQMIARALDFDASKLRAGQDALEQTAVPGEGYTTALPSKTEVLPRIKQPTAGKIRVLDLFCGAGGFSYGLEQTGHFTVTAGIDLLSDRIETFTRNHASANGIVADIRDFPIERLVAEACEPDVVVGGPPCQGFSSIRPFRTLTEGDPRNNLIENFLVVVRHIRPTWIVLENVVGLLTHAKGQVLKQTLDAFGEAGYTADWRVLNAAHFGLPQNRERLIIVGNSQGRKFGWPEPTHYVDHHRSMAGKHAEKVKSPSLFDIDLLPAVSVMDAIHDLSEVASGCETTSYRDDVESTAYEIEMREGSKDLTLHVATHHSEKMMEIIRHSGANRSALPEGMTKSGFSSSYSRLEPDRPSVTLTVNFVHPASNKCIHPYQNRALTLREGARLQGFPDRFHFCGKRANLAKQIGNAVPPVLGRAIGAALAEAMESGRSSKSPARGRAFRA